MPKPTQSLTKDELSSQLFRELERLVPTSNITLSKHSCYVIISKTLMLITAALAEGNKVTLRELGTFEAVFRPERPARDIVANRPITTTAHYTLKLKPSKQIKTKLTESLLLK